LQELEAIVTIDVLPMEIVGWSDVVLPEATYLERWDDLNVPGYRQPFVSLRQAAIAPMYESRPGWWIAKELGKRLGLASYFPWDDAESFVRTRAQAAGLDFERLKRDGAIKGPSLPIYFEEGAAPTFDTASGKIELYSPQLAALGFDPMPTWRDGELEEPPPNFYRLLTGRAPNHTFGRTANNRVLANGRVDDGVWVNRDVALKWGFHDGERVHLLNQDGVRSTFAAPVRITDRIRPDAVYIVHGNGHTARKLRFAHGKGIDDSELITRYKTDPIMGGTGMNVNFVTFVRASDVAAEASAGKAGA
jgi:thiosulfate reductase/polysulfide reductase chain A